VPFLDSIQSSEELFSHDPHHCPHHTDHVGDRRRFNSHHAEVVELHCRDLSDPQRLDRARAFEVASPIGTGLAACAGPLKVV
jgi:hypothetical protein